MDEVGADAAPPNTRVATEEDLGQPAPTRRDEGDVGESWKERHPVGVGGQVGSVAVVEVHVRVDVDHDVSGGARRVGLQDLRSHRGRHRGH